MSALLLTAFMLISGKMESTTVPFQVIRVPLIIVASELQLIDKRELRFTFDQAPNFEIDLELMRKRYESLKNAPLVEDSDRFPPRSIVNELLVFNRAYRKFLEERIVIDFIHEDELRSAIRQTDRLYQIWDSVRDATCEYYYVTVRREALKQLLELVGEENYYVGNLPLNVPIWFFNEVESVIDKQQIRRSRPGFWYPFKDVIIL